MEEGGGGLLPITGTALHILCHSFPHGLLKAFFLLRGDGAHGSDEVVERVHPSEKAGKAELELAGINEKTAEAAELSTPQNEEEQEESSNVFRRMTESKKQQTRSGFANSPTKSHALRERHIQTRMTSGFAS